MPNLRIAHVPVNSSDTRFLNEWRELLSRANPELQLFTPEWYQEWALTRGTTRRWKSGLTVITVRDSLNVLRGLLPLGCRKYGPFNVYGSAGDSQPWRPLLSDLSCARAVGTAVGQRLHELRLTAVQIGPTPSGHPAFQGLVDGLEISGTPARLVESRPLATTQLPGTWDEYRSTVLGSKFARKIGYYDRRFRKTADIQVEHTHQCDAGTTAQLVAELGEVESRSWLITAENSHPRYLPGTGAEMWQRLIDTTLAPSGQFDCWIMRADGKPVSFVFTLTARETRYFIANSYIESVSDHRTGSTLYQAVVQDAIVRGVRKLDFGSDEIHYKQRWGATYTDNLTTLFVGSSLQTRLILKTVNIVRPPQAAPCVSELTPTTPQSTPVTEADPTRMPV